MRCTYPNEQTLTHTNFKTLKTLAIIKLHGTPARALYIQEAKQADLREK